MSERLEKFPKAQNFHAFGNALCYNGHEPCLERRGAMYIKLTLQEKLKDERTNRHMTLAELEKATGIARATLGKYESDVLPRKAGRILRTVHGLPHGADRK